MRYLQIKTGKLNLRNMNKKQEDMKRNIFVYTIALACSLLIAACSQDENITLSNNDKNKILINITDKAIYNSSKTRATTDETYKTTFENEDQIGLFAVKNGEIAGSINNVCLIYNKTHDVWIPANGSLFYSSELEGATYYAYYPYKEEVSNSFKASIENPFAEIISNWKIGANMSGSEYTQYDLMTGSAEAELSGKNYSLNLTLEHQMAMVVIQLPSTTYEFTNQGTTIAPYNIPAANPTFKLTKGESENIEVQPYYEPSTDKYRLLINPTTTYKINGTFISSENKQYEIAITGIEKGTYAPYTVDGGTKKIQHELKIGDFYCADGTLIKADQDLESEDKTKIIGVIYQIGTTEAIRKDYPECTHALVYALKRNEGTGQRWGTVSSVSNKTWYTDILPAPVGTSSVNGQKIPNEEEFSNTGYQDTKAWLNSDIAVVGADINSVVKEKLSSYSVQAPSFTTGWYVPSVKELLIIQEQNTTISSSLTKADGETLWQDSSWERLTSGSGYWTSTLRSESTIWVYTGLNEEGHREKNYLALNLKTNSYYRFALAF